jgi:hypothetical protein
VLSEPISSDRSKLAAGVRWRINKHMRHTAKDLSDDQWKVLDRLIRKPKRRNDGRGLRRGFSFHQSFEHESAGGSENIGGHTRQFDIGAL